MCPLCIGTATLIASGGSSVGGLVAVVVRRFGRERREVKRGARRAAHAPSAAAAVTVAVPRRG